MNSSERAIYERLLIAKGNIAEVGPIPTGFLEELEKIKPSWTGLYFSNSKPLSEICTQHKIRRLSLLHLHGNASDLEVLRTGLSLLQNQRIDLIRLSIGPTPNTTGESLFDIATFLQSFGYLLVSIDSDTLKSLPRVECTGKNEQQVVTLIAMAPRFEGMFQSGKTDSDSLINLRTIFPAYSIQPRGVVHLGAHQAQELALYKELGFQRILFIEANPILANAIRERTINDPSVTVASCAVSDSNGSQMLRVTSSDQSSSILPLKLHRAYYPTIHESYQISVSTRRLDTLLEELNLPASDFNYLHMDIQGSELMALQGAPELLRHIEAITSEVNFEELYEGCGLIDDLEQKLESHGFDSNPIAISTPYHTSWGDAMYIRRKQPRVASADRGVLTARTLGSNGRFANQLFQYAFLRILAHHHGLRTETPKWVGQLLFGHSDPAVSKELHVLAEGHQFPFSVFPRPLFSLPIENVDLWGYFQYDTAVYLPHRDYFRSLFRPATSLAEKLTPALHRIVGQVNEVRERTLVALHIRRGDFQGKQFFPAPTAWYRGLLERVWPTLRSPVLYIASDEVDKVVADFGDYQPVTAADLDVEIPEAPFFPDFYMLSQSNVLAISNSSFSFAAAMLNEQDPICFRPNQHVGRLVQFDPWNAPVLLDRNLGEPMVHPFSR